MNKKYPKKIKTNLFILIIFTSCFCLLNGEDRIDLSTTSSNLTISNLKNDDSEKSQLAPENFFKNYTIHQISTQDRIKLLQNKSNLKKLGTEVVEGKISGTLTYQTKVDMKKLAGLVYMTWENYSDEDDYVFNGQIITHANMAGNGKLEGKITVNGTLNGEIIYDNIILKNSQAGDGFYQIKFSNSDSVNIPYTLYFEALNTSD